MPRKTRTVQSQNIRPTNVPVSHAGNTDAPPALRLLVVSPDPLAFKPSLQGIESSGAAITLSLSVAEARRALADSAFDVALLDDHLPDNMALELAQEIRRKQAPAQVIVLSHKASYRRAVDAVRAGAADLLSAPVDADELAQRVTHAAHRRRTELCQRQRIDRLRRICKELNAAREEVTRQVDLICNDLVTAYQELAEQMATASQTNEFAGLVRGELDLEALLRRTLEFLLQKTGPTNAAIFLPATADEFSLGGYVNYDCTADSADLLLQHLADVLAPKISEQSELLHVTDNDLLHRWIGDDAEYLADSHVLAVPCRHKDEVLAVLTLFRDHSQPFSDTAVETLRVIAPMLGEYLARIIRIHHRGLFNEE